MFVIVFKYLMPKWVRGLSLYPFVFLSCKEDKYNYVLINHEKIHIRQQLELAVVFFYIWYLVEFLVRYFQFKNVKNAYLNISFEREAYQNEQNLIYLSNRPFFKFVSFF